MGDPAKEAGVEIGGQRFRLVFTIGARRRLETHFGKKLPEIMRQFMETTDDLEILIPALWAFMQKHHADTALEDVEALCDDLDHGDIDILMNAVADAIMREAKVREAPGADPTKAGKRKKAGSTTSARS